MSNTKKILKKRNTPTVWVIIILAFIMFIPSFIMSHLFMKVNSVRVLDSKIGSPVKMLVDREIKNDFYGTYSVTIKRKNGEFVCHGIPKVPIGYTKDSTLPDPLYLRWWLGGKKQLDECKSEGYGEGEYYIVTCHTMLITVWDIPFARTCHKSNNFYIEKGL